jgi:hypothetical protein
MSSAGNVAAAATQVNLRASPGLPPTIGMDLAGRAG